MRTSRIDPQVVHRAGMLHIGNTFGAVGISIKPGSRVTLVYLGTIGSGRTMHIVSKHTSRIAP